MRLFTADERPNKLMAVLFLVVINPTMKSPTLLGALALSMPMQ